MGMIGCLFDIGEMYENILCRNESVRGEFITFQFPIPSGVVVGIVRFFFLYPPLPFFLRLFDLHECDIKTPPGEMQAQKKKEKEITELGLHAYYIILNIKISININNPI